MTIANGSRHSLAYILETVPGTTPATPAFKAARNTGVTLALSKETLVSNEIRSDRQITDMRHGTYQVGGDLSVELSYGSFDDLLEAALGGTWTENVLKGGSTRRAFTFERNFADIGQYLRYTGCEVNSLSMSVAPSAMVTGSFGILGLSQSIASTIITGATYGAPTTSSPMDSFTGVIEEGGSTIAVVTAVELSVDNGMSPLFVIGQKSAADMSVGRFTVTGSVTAYFDSVAMLNKFIDETESDLSFVTSGTGGDYEWVLPRIKYTGGQPDVSGEGPITLQMPFQALYDTASSTTLQVTRTPNP